MNTTLWVLQAILAAIFVMSGTAKSFMTKQRMLQTGQTGVAPFPLWIIRIVAVLEIVGALGLILPWLTENARVLTPLAATGLALVMVGAAVSHWSLREFKQVFGVNLVLFAMLTIVVIGRYSEL
ncbi:hypothetical protein TUM20985_33990 [Mycobacterium antarcticum]|uniref:DoxX family protein n=1 Tax=unclassified Mycolicibacterium TaxID=2636767 RepID=UPI00238C0E17|nr:MULTISPECIES: DoxX family protein [unclassified Mycolicibacterium]BDX32852.1 hypothetical protein TUM20985_33990 [Mycolicibacterium sp. TUM20985]GLP76035.1 hypothetical protein TUM20983_31450 [Mycolicibacterium sp. TUM20983]